MKKKFFLLFMLFALLLAGCGHTEFTPEALEVQTAVSQNQGAEPINLLESSPELEIESSETQPNFWEDFKNAGYTKENPLTDPKSMTALLTALEELQYSNFDQPGWYYMTCGEEEIIWLHFSEPRTHIFDQS